MSAAPTPRGGRVTVVSPRAEPPRGRPFPARGLALVAVWLLCATVASAQDEAPAFTWHDARTLTLEGQAWEETAAPYDRLPARAEGVVRDPVWNLSRHSAGMCVLFRTDATELRVRWTVTNGSLAMAHMPATGVSGVDLYLHRDDDATAPGGWRWVGTGKPHRREGNEAELATELDGATHDWRLYLPLYNGTESLEIGVPEGATIAPLPRAADRAAPIVFYGTSITHGASASRPGMTHVAILGRRLDRPVVNLGFSGNGTMDASMGDLLAELDAAAYVIDCLPNMNGEAVAQRAAPLVRQLREARPDTPILLVEDRTYAYAHARPSAAERNATSRAALREAYETLLAEGVTGLRYLEGDALLGDDGDATVDGSHPNDLGFMRQADAMEPALREMLGGR